MDKYKHSLIESNSSKRIAKVKKLLKHKHGTRWFRHDDGGQEGDKLLKITREITAHVALTDEGILGYINKNCNSRAKAVIKKLESISVPNGYQVNLIDIYKNIFSHYWPDYENFEDFINKWSNDYLVKLTPYRSSGLMSGFNIENKYILKNLFENLGISNVNIDNIIIKPGGFKSIYSGILLALTTAGTGEDRIQTNLNMLIRIPYYASIIKFPHLLNINIHSSQDFSIETIEKLINDKQIRIIYLSVLGNPDGKIWSKEEYTDFAKLIINKNIQIYNENCKILNKSFESIDDYLQAVQEYNMHPDQVGLLSNFIWIISDEVYLKSNYKSSKPTFSIASYKLNDKSQFSINSELEDMHTYTFTCISPSKTFGYATSRVGFCTTGTKYMIERLNTAYKELLIREVNPLAEISSIAQMCFMNDSILEENNQLYFERSNFISTLVQAINADLSYIQVSITEPDGGWFQLLTFNINRLNTYIIDSIDLAVYFMSYANFYGGTGVIMNPAILYGYETAEADINMHYSLRITLAKSDAELDKFIEDVKKATTKLDIICGIISGEIKTITEIELNDLYFNKEYIVKYIQCDISITDLAESELKNIINH